MEEENKGEFHIGYGNAFVVDHYICKPYSLVVHTGLALNSFRPDWIHVLIMFCCQLRRLTSCKLFFS